VQGPEPGGSAAEAPVVVLVHEAEPDLGALDFARSHALVHARPVLVGWWGAELAAAARVPPESLDRMTGLQLLGAAMSAVRAERAPRRSRRTRPDLAPLLDGGESLVIGPAAFRRLLAAPGHAGQVDELACPTYVVSGGEPRPTGVLCVARRRSEVHRLVRAGLREAAARRVPLRVVHAWRPPDAHRYAERVRGDQSGRAMDVEDLAAAVREATGAVDEAPAVEVHYREPRELVDEGVRGRALVLVGDVGLVPRPPARTAPATGATGVVAVVPATR
jgi:hypothetical protein